MNPTTIISLDKGVPLCKCTTCGGPARAVSLAVEWTGETQVLRGTFTCDENYNHRFKMRVDYIEERMTYDWVVTGE